MIINTMVVDALAPYIMKIYAAIVLTMQDQQIHTGSTVGRGHVKV